MSSATVTATLTKKRARIFRPHLSEIFHRLHHELKSKSLFHPSRLKASNCQIAHQCRPLDDPPQIKSKLNGIWSVLCLTILCFFLQLLSFFVAPTLIKKSCTLKAYFKRIFYFSVKHIFSQTNALKIIPIKCS